MYLICPISYLGIQIVNFYEATVNFEKEGFIANKKSNFVQVGFDWI